MPVSTGIQLDCPAKEGPAGPCVMVIFGASGDLTRRLLMPAIYNLVCDGLLPENFAIVGMALDEMTTDEFRTSQRANIQRFMTRKAFDPAKWEWLESRLYYTAGNFSDVAAFERLKQLVAEVDAKVQAQDNALVYLAIAPAVFELVTRNLDLAGFKQRNGWLRIIVEKPFGKDLQTAIELNRAIRAHWDEDQIYRIDHYLGKETVQNILTFRFANSVFEPLWNKNHIDHIQISVMETVGVEGRGGYYDKSGVLRDMIQNHMFQMLAYIGMEPPASFAPNAIRDEKAKLLEAVRIPTAEDLARDCVRGQYGPGATRDGKPVPGYRQEPSVNPESNIETFVAMKLHLDNWRWEGVPVYLRSGKALWKRGTEIVIQFKRAPDVLFRNTPSAGSIQPNLLIFHIQPDQGVEFRVQAKHPGPHLSLQKVDMRFDYSESFEASRGTGYEVLLYSAINGDATLFSRTDFVEAAWRIAQPMLEQWSSTPQAEFPNYSAGTWGPRAAYDLPAKDGRFWHEVITREVLANIPILQDANLVFLKYLSLALKPQAVEAGKTIVNCGDLSGEMYFICRGEVEVITPEGKPIRKLIEGDFFGEMSLLLNQPRSATIRASRPCDLFVLGRNDFLRTIKDFPEVEQELRKLAVERSTWGNTGPSPSL